MANKSYRQMLTEALKHNGEDWGDVVRINGKARDDDDEPDIDRVVNTGFGCVEGPSITAWTKRRVYFGAQYDGAEWIASVPRDPCDEVVEHVGG